MPTEHDTDAKLAAYAHPERLVTTAWLAERLGTPGLVVVESSEDVLLYDTGHVPTAVKVDWHTELNDPVTRDYVDGEGFAALMRAKGISRDDTVVVYGDKNNWWAAYALWVFTLFGHEDVRLLDGGRTKWEAEGRGYTTDKPQVPTVDYPVVERDDSEIRAFLPDVQAHIGRPMVDVRSPEEYTGQRTHMPAYPDEGALRGGHIPGAQSVPWARAVAEDGGFKTREELEAVYTGEKGLQPTDDVVAYCRIGERSSHTWFVLTHLLGFEKVRNYDGSWTEWGNAVRVPIARGEEPGGGVSETPGGTGARSLPGRFDEVVDDFQALEEPHRLELLLDFANGLPDLPERLAAHQEVMEAVPECQSPVFVHVEVDGTGPAAPVHVFLSAPREAPTTRGFAAILAEGMTGLDAQGVLSVPDDVPHLLGLDRAVSLLRLRGMSGMLGRIQRQVREKAGV